MNKVFLCLVAICMFACDKTLGPPKGILPERKMISILVDLQVAESKVKSLRVSSDSVRHIYSIYEVQIFDKHNVTPKEYLRSYEYYLENHRLMSRVHDAVLDTLLKRQQKVERMPDPAPIQNPDSAALAQEGLQQETLRLEALRRDSLSRDSLSIFWLKPNAERKNLLPPFFQQDRNQPVLRSQEVQ